MKSSMVGAASVCNTVVDVNLFSQQQFVKLSPNLSVGLRCPLLSIIYAGSSHTATVSVRLTE